MDLFGGESKTKRERVLAVLQGLTWTSWRELERVGGNRYRARVDELINRGYRIETMKDPSNVGNCYRLLDLVPGPPQRKQVKIYFDEDDAAALTRSEVTPAAAVAATEALRTFRANKHKL